MQKLWTREKGDFNSIGVPKEAVGSLKVIMQLDCIFVLKSFGRIRSRENLLQLRVNSNNGLSYEKATTPALERTIR